MGDSIGIVVSGLRLCFRMYGYLTATMPIWFQANEKNQADFIAESAGGQSDQLEHKLFTEVGFKSVKKIVKGLAIEADDLPVVIAGKDRAEEMLRVVTGDKTDHGQAVVLVHVEKEILLFQHVRVIFRYYEKKIPFAVDEFVEIFLFIHNLARNPGVCLGPPPALPLYAGLFHLSVRRVTVNNIPVS